VEGVRLLADHVIARHYPEAARAGNPYHALLDLVVSRQAALVAQWMLVGFIHGVMNTDNMSIAGETIDYGPCAFMDFYHPGTVYSSIDAMGRYAYARQPRMAQWNLARFAETLLPLYPDGVDKAAGLAQETVRDFMPRYEAAYMERMRKKLGLFRPEPGDPDLAKDLLARMASNGADFTSTFRRLCDAAMSQNADAAVQRLFADPAAFDEWACRWRARLAIDGGDPIEGRAVMRRANPAFIPRNHLVEEAIAAAYNGGDFGAFETLLGVLQAPYDERPGFERYAVPPRPEQIVHETFCGT
jgi:uncharacterized protein YdiU (UPF0061 family)